MDADDEAESRLQKRLQRKTSSLDLGAQEDAAGMFGKEKADLAAPGAGEKYQVTDSKQHLEAFQSVFQKMRSRKTSDERDVSDSMKKVMEYVMKKKQLGAGK